MIKNSTCPDCGAPLSSDGLCARCELAVALETALPAGQMPVESPESTLRRFGDYELIEELGHGGMGVVYKARHLKLNRIVALKMLLLGQFSSEQAIKRFQREAQAAAALRDPNIVAVHDVGEVDGQHYFTMQFIEGRSLASILREGPLPSRQAATYCGGIAKAISSAHSAGILHRDLKPSNIVIDAVDQPHITDFGLAKRFAASDTTLAAGAAGFQGVGEDLTLSGQIVGSPNYLAPELAAGNLGQVTPATDLFSIGAMLYECLTGRPPFISPTLQETLLRIRDTEAVSPRTLNSNVPRSLETICLKCLQKEPAKRYVTAQELANDLQRYLQNEPIHARPVMLPERVWRWCRRKPALATAYSLVILLVILILIASPIALFRINQALQRTEQESLKARQFAYASDMNLAHQAVQEDDFYRALQLLDRHRPAANPLRSSRREEALISKSEIRNPKSEIDLRGWEWRYLWRQCQGEERFILGEHTNGATAVGLLADGKTVFSAGRDKFVRLWDLESRGQIGLLPHAEEVIGAAASPDGRWLATASMKGPEGQPVLLWDLASRKIAATLTTNFWLRPGSITFSPDSQWLAFATVFGGLRLWNVKARSEVTNLLASSPSSAPLGLAFSPDSRTLAYSGTEDGAILLWNLASRSVIGRLAGHQSVVIGLAFSPDGRTLASGSDDRTARLWNLAERRERLQFANQSGGVTSLAFFPDGRTLAMSGEGGAGRVIRLVDVETGSQKSELRGHLKSISSLTFTPDGQTLLSASDDGTLRVWDLVARAKEKLVHEFARNSISTAWRSYGPALCLSPDGRHLLTLYTNQTFSVWDTLRLAEGARQPLPFTNTTFAAVAPGGRLAAFGSRSGEVMLWDGETIQARSFAWPGTNYIGRLVFSLDGRHLAAADDSKALAQMSVASDTKRTVRVWDMGARKQTHFFPTDEDGLPVSLTFSADARALMAGFSEGPIKLWPLDGPGEAAHFLGHSGWVRGLAMLTNGQTLVSAGPDIRFWDVRTRRETDKLNPRTGEYNCLALSSDGRRFATGAGDGLISIWDVASHQEVATLEGHKEQVMQLAFTPDGDHLVSVSKDQLRVWRAASPAETDAAEKEARK